MTRNDKRKADLSASDATNKKAKTWNKGKRHRSNDYGATDIKAIDPGDAGIWATCVMGKEGKCVGELRDILEEYAEKMYGDQEEPDEEGYVEGSDDQDIESAIRKEVQDIKRPKTRKAFTAVRINVQCLLFFKAQPPVDPVLVVQRICEDAFASKHSKKSRFIKRLTPVSLIGRASVEGLEEVARKVLAPRFHQENGISKKFAIRPAIRNHNTLSRDFVINRVAAIVGPGHRVDLKDYDLLILVDIYKNVCGMSVVQAGYDRLKRYNLAELYDPTPKLTPTPTTTTTKADETGLETGSESLGQRGAITTDSGVTKVEAESEDKDFNDASRSELSSKEEVVQTVNEQTASGEVEKQEA